MAKSKGISPKTTRRAINPILASQIHGIDAKENYKVTWRPTASLKPYANNARTHDAAQIGLIAKSIAEYGFTNPILIDESNGIIAGHGRVLGAAKNKMAEVPCIILAGLNDAQRRAYVIADNKIAMGSGWNSELLRMELNELKNLDFDLSLTGFKAGELDHLLKFGAVADGENDIPAAPDKPITKPGDIWLLGGHRVICGDSTDPAVVKALLGDDVPRLMVTDPPYGVEYEPEWREKTNQMGKMIASGKVNNDDRADWREAWELFPGNIAYVWHAGLKCNVVFDLIVAAGYKIRAQIIWKKPSPTFSRGDYHFEHEPCFYAVKGTGFWTGDRKQSTVWEFPGVNPVGGGGKGADKKVGHGTQKPVEAMRRPMLNNSSAGDFVYDPFLGSGTTVIAAETSGRIALGVELNPAYVDVIVKRWQELNGGKAIHAKTRKEFGA